MSSRPRSYSYSPNEEAGDHPLNAYPSASQPENPFTHPSETGYNNIPPVPPHGAPMDYDTSYLRPGHQRAQDSYSSMGGSPERNSYYENPFNRPAGMEDIDPHEIADDGDDDITDARRGQRRSFLPAGAAAGGAAAGAAGMFAALGNRDASGQYSSVAGGGEAARGMGGEQPVWMGGAAAASRPRKKLLWTICAVIAVIVVVGAVAGGIAGYIIHRNDDDDGSSTETSGLSAEQDLAQNGDLGLHSDEIQDLLGNDDLHRVFPGVDYTPLNTQYPDCLTYPPSQNNVTRDLAVLSQLTKTIRLYGTDCNQTNMVLHAIDRLELSGDDGMKVWLGVWLDNNRTTSRRQLNAMWDILDEHGADPFAGVVVGNELLFSSHLTAAQLGAELDDVKAQLQKRGIDLPIATSDLGSNWEENPTLVDHVDVLMANVHPYFAGVEVEKAARWTEKYWKRTDVPLTQGTNKRNMISETGWPTGGGTDRGSVAGIDELNTFMEGWVCKALDKGIEYFWFEAFDEPWKERFNTEKSQVEDKWGLMDVNRNLKEGVKIPDCGGKEV